MKVRRVGGGGPAKPGGPGGRRPGGSPSGCGWLLLKWLVSALSVYLAALLLEPHVQLAGFGSALLVAAVLGLLNAFIRPFMILLTLPITVLTLGLFLIVINAVILSLAAVLVPGFDIAHFGWALLASLLISGIHLLLDSFVEALTGRR